MKRRINLYAAGCALLMIVFFLILPIMATEGISISILDLMKGIQYNEMLMEALPYTYILILAVDIVLLISALFIDSRISLGLGIAGAVFTWMETAVLVFGLEGFAEIMGIGCIANIVLVVLFCILEGLRNRLPGYKGQKIRETWVHPQPQQYGYQPAPQGYAPQGYQPAPQGYAPQGYQPAPQGYAPQGYQPAPQGYAPQGYQPAPQGYAPQGYQPAPQGYVPKGQYQPWQPYAQPGPREAAKPAASADHPAE